MSPACQASLPVVLQKAQSSPVGFLDVPLSDMCPCYLTHANPAAIPDCTPGVGAIPLIKAYAECRRAASGPITTTCDQCCDAVSFSGTSHYQERVGFVKGPSVPGKGYNGCKDGEKCKDELSTAPSVEACAAECDQAPRCMSFHWLESNNRCNLKMVGADATTLQTSMPWQRLYVAYQKVSIEPGHLELPYCCPCTTTTMPTPPPTPTCTREQVGASLAQMSPACQASLPVVLQKAQSSPVGFLDVPLSDMCPCYLTHANPAAIPDCTPGVGAIPLIEAHAECTKLAAKYASDMPDFRKPITGFYKGDALGSKKGVSLQECADFCLSKKNRCRSFQYQAANKLCGLKKVRVFSSLGAATPANLLACSKRARRPLHVDGQCGLGSGGPPERTARH